MQAVLFDLDCTLTDRRRSIAAAADLLHRTYRLECSIGRLDAAMWRADHWGYRDRREFFGDIICEIGWTNGPAMPELLRFWAEDHPTCALPQADTFDVLQDLRGRGFRIGIVTNGDRQTQSAKIRQLELEKYVDCVVISGALGIRKPDPRIFQHALGQLGAEAEKSLFVGDHPENDIVGATNAGMQTAWIRAGGDYPGHYPEPTYRISCLSELLQHVRGRAGSGAGVHVGR